MISNEDEGDTETVRKNIKGKGMIYILYKLEYFFSHWFCCFFFTFLWRSCSRLHWDTCFMTELKTKAFVWPSDFDKETGRVYSWVGPCNAFPWHHYWRGLKGLWTEGFSFSPSHTHTVVIQVWLHHYHIPGFTLLPPSSSKSLPRSHFNTLSAPTPPLSATPMLGSIV